MRNILSGSGSFLNYIASPYLGYIETRRHHARVARVRRQLARLPRYVADDIGFGPNQTPYINNLDD